MKSFLCISNFVFGFYFFHAAFDTYLVNKLQLLNATPGQAACAVIGFLLIETGALMACMPDRSST
jgi:surface polysaccharide O-acyltransferase-like enzyme